MVCWPVGLMEVFLNERLQGKARQLRTITTLVPGMNTLSKLDITPTPWLASTSAEYFSDIPLPVSLMLCPFRLLKKVCLCENRRSIIVLTGLLDLMLCSLAELREAEGLREGIEGALGDSGLEDEGRGSSVWLSNWSDICDEALGVSPSSSSFWMWVKPVAVDCLSF